MEHLVVDDGLVERVGADQHGRDVPLDDPEGMQAALHGRGLAIADYAVRRGDAHERGATARRIARRPTDLEGLDRLDFRGCSQRLASSLGLEGRTAAVARAKSALVRSKHAVTKAEPGATTHLAAHGDAGSLVGGALVSGQSAQHACRRGPWFRPVITFHSPVRDLRPLWLLSQRYANCIRMQYDSPCMRVTTPMRRSTCARSGRPLRHHRRS